MLIYCNDRLLYNKKLNKLENSITIVSNFQKIFFRNNYNYQNQLSWKKLENEMKNILGNKIYNRIIENLNINIDNKIKQGKKLSKKTIYSILLTANCICSTDIEMNKEINIPSFENLCGINVPKFNGMVDFLAGLPTKFTAIFSHDRNQQLKELLAILNLIRRSIVLNNLSFHAFLEILAKEIIYREPIENLIIPAPHPNNDNQIIYYHIHKFISSGKGGTFAYLRPIVKDKNIYPIIVFSGSQFHPSGLDSLSSCIADTEFKLGEEAFDSIKFKLDLLLFHFKNEKIIVTGHSLGGNLAQYFSANYLNLVKELVTFSSPGIHTEINQLFDNKLKKMNNLPKISIYQTDNDIVHYAGGEHLGYNNLDKLDFHITKFKSPQNINLFFDNPFYFFIRPHTYSCLLNVRELELESTKFIYPKNQRKVLKSSTHNRVEYLRKNLGGLVISPILKKIRSIVRTISSSRSKKYTLL